MKRAQPTVQSLATTLGCGFEFFEPRFTRSEGRQDEGVAIKPLDFIIFPALKKLLNTKPSPGNKFQRNLDPAVFDKTVSVSLDHSENILGSGMFETCR